MDNTRVFRMAFDVQTFFAAGAADQSDVSKITGMICGYRVEGIEDPLMRQIRCLDKLVDDWPEGRPPTRL